KIRNVDPKGTNNPDRARPFKIAPMPCSRMPKCKLRPVKEPGPTSPPPRSVVFTLPAKSAEPPTSRGTSSAAFWIKRPECERVASSLETQAATKDRKSTRLNSSHVKSSYAVFCLYK